MADSSSLFSISHFAAFQTIAQRATEPSASGSWQSDLFVHHTALPCALVAEHQRLSQSGHTSIPHHPIRALAVLRNTIPPISEMVRTSAWISVSGSIPSTSAMSHMTIFTLSERCHERTIPQNRKPLGTLVRSFSSSKRGSQECHQSRLIQRYRKTFDPRSSTPFLWA